MTCLNKEIQREDLLAKGTELASPLPTFRLFVYQNRKFTLLTKYPNSQPIEICESVTFKQQAEG